MGNSAAALRSACSSKTTRKSLLPSAVAFHTWEETLSGRLSGTAPTTINKNERNTPTRPNTEATSKTFCSLTKEDYSRSKTLDKTFTP